MRAHLLFSASAFILHCSAQTGPGGVGTSNSNILWLDANYGVTAPTLAVTAWADRSGNGNHAVQGTTNLQPALANNTVNGYPAIVFDNDQSTPDYLRVPDNSTLEGMSGLTAFCVYQLAAGTVESAPRGFFSKRNAPDSQEAYAWFIYNGGGTGTNRDQYLDIDGTGNRIHSTPTSYATGTNYINSFVYSGTVPSNSSDQILYNGNTAVGNGTETSTSIPNYTSDLYIGTLRGHTGSGASTARFNGWMSEIILFNQVLGTAQRTIINNYLAAKYAIAMASLDLYSQDDPANGNYDHEVAGIGRSSNDGQSDSRGTGMVQISNASNLDVDEYLLWGHDNGPASAWGSSTDYPAGLQARLTRVWRVSEVNAAALASDVGAVNITFHLTGFAGVFATNLRLLVDANNNGIFSDDAPITGAVGLGNGRYRFSGVTALADRLRFTLGTIQSDTALPIELVSFTAATDRDQVRLDWVTASEQDNDHFTVERSKDGSEWDTVLEVNGAGNSSTSNNYNGYDTTPLTGTSFYRLRQTDTDGGSTLSGIRSILRSGLAAHPLVVPNPANGNITVMGTGNRSIRVLDATGRSVSFGLASSPMDISMLPDGAYRVSIEELAGPVLVPFIVQH